MIAVPGLGAGYQAALALSFLADTDEKEDRDIDREPGIAEKWLAQQSTPSTTLADLSTTSIKSPFAPEPQPTAMMAHGGEVQHLAGGGLPYAPSAMVRPSAKKELEDIKSQYDTYNTQADLYNTGLTKYQTEVAAPYNLQADAYNKAAEAYNLGPRTSDFTMTMPTAPAEYSMAAPTAPTVSTADYEAKAIAAKKDTTNRNLALQVMANPEQYGLSVNQMFADGGEVEEPSLLRTSGYATGVAREMYPAQQGQFDQQDAARHMLAAGTLARKYGDTAAGMMGNLHEITTSPLRWAGSKLGISEMPVDYEQDLHNNRIGIELAKRSKSQKDLEDLVQQMAEQAKGQQTKGQAWTGKPVRRADGGPAEPTPEEIAAASRPATVNPNIQRQGEAARRLAAMRDVNALPDPKTYAAVSGFLGTPPDEQGFSVMHPQREGIKQAGEAGFYTGTALQVAPMMGALRAAGVGPSSAGKGATAAQQLGAVKMRGGTFGYSGQPEDVSKLGYLMSELTEEAKSARVPQELQDFLKAKAPKYFSTTYGTADDPLRTAIRERRIEPFGRDQPKLTPYLIDAARNPEARGHLQAKLDLERMYDEMSGVRAYAFKPEGSDITERALRKDISEKMGQEGVPIEARNPPSIDAFSKEEFASYPSSSRMLRQLVESQESLPPHVQRALKTGEPIFDVDPNMALLRPSNIIEALQEVPANKLKNMSFPEALIQGTQALAPIRDYRTAVDLADKGAAVPRKALDMFTTPVAKAPSVGGEWVQLIKPVATELEGKLMKHSIGGYGAGDSYGTGYTGLPYGGKKAFDDGLVQVYSLRDKQGLPEITVEMAKSNAGKGDTWDVTQIRGRFNSEPSPQTREDIFSLLDKIDSKEGLDKIKSNSYIKSSAGETVPGSEVNWSREYDLWKQSASE